ncbi:uncharacterized protein LOC124925933 [Impatiens glandulifera]|uniref:uncharacterized protein LOC124925933 n=1 Tax=Impatiens glandulifera TaxID=253017 RepID=UPI001FB0F074|nr:uncharacterized protein LOC124925933 [Impatiens glandulifera]
MIKRSTFSFFIFYLSIQTLATLTPATDSYARFNISLFLFPRIADDFRPQPSTFLEDVLKAISIRQNWNETSGVKVTKLDSANAKFGDSRRYDIRLRVGKSEVSFRLRDEVSLWKKLKNGGEFEPSVREIGSNPVLDKFLIRGPLELLMNGSDELLLQLPLNVTHTGLKRILVGEGIMVEVRNAQEVTLFHSLQQGFNSKVRTHFSPFEHESCTPLFPIHISGPASVIAYSSRNQNAHVVKTFLSKDTIKLLPEICYAKDTNRNQRFPVDSLKSRIVIIDKLMRSLVSDKHARSSLKVKIKASTVVRFKIDLERDTKLNDSDGTRESTMAEWRTRPNMERVCYEVVARIDEDRLKPLVVKRSRPFIEVDTYAWSDLLSNISFTKFPSLMVPPESLTLDVKW